MFSWGWDSVFAKGTERDMGFRSLFSLASETLEFALPFVSRTLLLGQALQTERKRATSKIDLPKTARWQNRTFCAYSCASGNAFTRKKNVLSPNFKERDDAKSFEINCHVCLPAIISDLSFADTWTKENKTVN